MASARPKSMLARGSERYKQQEGTAAGPEAGPERKEPSASGLASAPPPVTKHRPPVSSFLTSGAKGSFHAPHIEAEAFSEDNSLEENVWAGPVLIGTHVAGAAASLEMLFLLAINVLLQALFFYILSQSDVTKPSMTNETVESLQHWRVHVGHDVKFLAEGSNQTLARRVCEGDAGLEVGADQRSTIEQVNSYLSSTADDSPDDSYLGTGVLMCGIALLVWILSVCKELEDARTLLLFLFRAKSRHGTSVRQVPSGAVLVDRLSFRRVVANLVVVAVRLVIAGGLLWYGSLFLIYTVDIVELMLNAVALEFVLNIDELIFKVLAPAHFKKVIKAARMQRAPKVKTWRGADFISLINFLGATMAFFLFLGLLVLPQVRTLIAVQNALCAGDLDFVYTINGIGILGWTFVDQKHALEGASLAKRNWPVGGSAADDPDDVSTPGLTGTMPERTIKLLLRQRGRKKFQRPCDVDARKTDVPEIGTKSLCFSYEAGDLATAPAPYAREDAADCCLVSKMWTPLLEGGAESVRGMSIESVVSAVDLWNPVCLDMNVRGSGATVGDLLAGALKAVVDSEPCRSSCGKNHICLPNGTCALNTCTGAQPFCQHNSLVGIRTRQMCPQTCGCDKPRSALALSLPNQGCGDRCPLSGSYRRELANLPCEDVPPSDPNFQELMDDMDKVAESWPLDWRSSFQGVWGPSLRKHGCDWLSASREKFEAGAITFGAYYSGINWCHTLSYYKVKPLAVFCPVACGCRRGDPNCPSTCPARNDSALCAEHLRSQWATLPYPNDGACPMMPERHQP